SVARIRAAGFEMLWTGQRRLVRAPRGGVVEIEAEVRNRDTLAARFVRLRAVASSQLAVTLEPDRGEVMASGRLKVKAVVKTPRWWWRARLASSRCRSPSRTRTASRWCPAPSWPI